MELFPCRLVCGRLSGRKSAPSELFLRGRWEEEGSEAGRALLRSCSCAEDGKRKAVRQEVRSCGAVPAWRMRSEGGWRSNASHKNVL